MLILTKNKSKVFFMEDTVKIFIAGLKKWAKLNKISQTDLADVIDKDQTTISNYYRGKTRPTPEIITLWIDHYNLDYEEILNAGRQELQPKTDHQTLTKPVVERMIHEALSQPTNDLTKYSRKQNVEHHKLIDRFKEPEKALKLNQLIFEIESLDEKALDHIQDYLNSKLKRLRGSKLSREEASRGNRPA